MALPLIPFAAGIAVGALAAYGFKDETVRDMAERGVRWVSDSVAGAYSLVAGAVGGVFGAGAVSAEGPVADAASEQREAAAGSQTTAADQPATPMA